MAAALKQKTSQEEENKDDEQTRKKMRSIVKTKKEDKLGEGEESVNDIYPMICFDED